MKLFHYVNYLTNISTTVIWWNRKQVANLQTFYNYRIAFYLSHDYFNLVLILLPSRRITQENYVDTHSNLDINISATIVKAHLDTDRQGFSYANAPQSVGVSRHHA